mgnify:CR=1 FL=1
MQNIRGEDELIPHVEKTKRAVTQNVLHPLGTMLQWSGSLEALNAMDAQVSLMH